MLDTTTITAIEEFVYAKPRSIQEIAQLINKNWRTADRYVDEIGKNFGTISTRVFRGGTRGALKIIYWSSVEKVSSSIFQERLEKEILLFKRKGDFSAFDIFQYVPDRERKSVVRSSEQENIKDLNTLLLQAKQQVLIFSGNLSFINIRDKKRDMTDTLELLIQRKIKIKILCRVDLAGSDNIERVLSLNAKYGKNLIEIRHDAHPLRGVIIDGAIISLKEVNEPTGKINELNTKTFIYYKITNKSWAEWLSKVFWKKFTNSMDAYKRIEHLKSIRV